MEKQKEQGTISTVIARSEATWQSPGTSYIFLVQRQEIATPSARNDEVGGRQVLLYEAGRRSEVVGGGSAAMAKTSGIYP